MKIYIENLNDDRIGGGWSFKRNFVKGMSKLGHQFVSDWKECDVFFISGVTLVDKGSVHQALAMGKRIVFRVDNVPRKSRNRRMSPSERMKEFSEIADLVIYQSKWSKEYAGILCGEGVVIYNGVDTDVFNKGDREYSDHRYLFVQYNRDENKRFEEARYFFQKYNRDRKADAKKLILNIVGQFSPELVEANFDFFNDEKIVYHGVIEDPMRLADIMRSSDVLLYPSFADSCPNTVLEAIASGMMICLVNYIGGTGELVSHEMYDVSLDRMCAEYDNAMKGIL